MTPFMFSSVSPALLYISPHPHPGVEKRKTNLQSSLPPNHPHKLHPPTVKNSPQFLPSLNPSTHPPIPSFPFQPRTLRGGIPFPSPLRFTPFPAPPNKNKNENKKTLPSQNTTAKTPPPKHHRQNTTAKAPPTQREKKTLKPRKRPSLSM